MKKLFLVVSALVAIGAGALLWLRAGGRQASQPPPPATANTAGQGTSGAAPPGAPQAPAGTPGARRSRRITREEFDRLRALVEAARQRRMSAPAPAPAEGPAAPAGGVQDYPRGRPGEVRAYLAAQIEELNPLVQQCYALAARETPGLAGELAVMFTVEGEPEVGGIISESDIIDGGLSSSQRLSECVRESMYAIRLEPPDKGMKIVINKTFSFTPGAGLVTEAEDSRKQNQKQNN
jgi:hypothetical protein